MMALRTNSQFPQMYSFYLNLCIFRLFAYYAVMWLPSWGPPVPVNSEPSALSHYIAPCSSIRNDLGLI